MSDYRKIADKLAPRRVTFADPKAPQESGITKLCRTFDQYPIVFLLCATTIAAAVATVILFATFVASKIAP
jgi:hypothetical protein